MGPGEERFAYESFGGPLEVALGARTKKGVDRPNRLASLWSSGWERWRSPDGPSIQPAASGGRDRCGQSSTCGHASIGKSVRRDERFRARSSSAHPVRCQQHRHFDRRRPLGGCPFSNLRPTQFRRETPLKRVGPRPTLTEITRRSAFVQPQPECSFFVDPAPHAAHQGGWVFIAVGIWELELGVA